MIKVIFLDLVNVIARLQTTVITTLETLATTNLETTKILVFQIFS